jgi:hypothetical protein
MRGLQINNQKLSLGAGFETDVARRDNGNSRAAVSLG